MDCDIKARVLAFLIKQSEWSYFSDRQKINAPEFDQAVAELVAEGKLEQYEERGRVYDRAVLPQPKAGA